MHNNRITRFLSRLPRQPAEEPSSQPEHFAALPLAQLPPAMQQAVAKHGDLYRWAYEQALVRRGQ